MNDKLVQTVQYKQKFGYILLDDSVRAEQHLEENLSLPLEELREAYRELHEAASKYLTVTSCQPRLGGQPRDTFHSKQKIRFVQEASRRLLKALGRKSW